LSLLFPQPWGFTQGPLTVDRILDHAASQHGHREIVTRSLEGPIVRTTWREIHARAKRLSSALLDLGVKPGDRVATLAWNSGRHIEAWYAIMGIGAVCHTLNPRLFPEQLCYIIGHAQDKILITDVTFLPVLAAHRHNMPTVERVIVLGDGEVLKDCPIADALCSEELIATHGADAVWGGFDERTACGLCYTSGTTGNPKGVLYSHRSNYIHALTTLQADVMGLSVRDTVLAVVPMFHANAWGLTFSCPAVGAKLVMPGQKMDGASILELLETEKVTFSAAVPTVWQMLLAHLKATGQKPTTLKKVVIGGAAVPEAIVRAFHDDYGVDVIHAWGMTETSPLGTLSTPTPEVAALSFDGQMPYKLKQGRPPLGVELKLTDDDGAPVAQDGEAFGRLKIRGPFIAREYFGGEGGKILDDEGFFDTGDVATIDADHYMQITDRAKDVIKSGGEWISSIEIENIAASHPKALMAAVIGLPHPKWDERPLLLVKLREGETATAAEFATWLDGKIARWWMPDEILFVDDIPLGATGKIDKKLIRQRFAAHVLPTAHAEAV
jgi:fatty-acyl-CoA synthase